VCYPSIQLIELLVLSVSPCPYRRCCLAGLGGPVAKLCGPVAGIRGVNEFAQPLDAAFQLDAQFSVGSLVPGGGVVAGVGAVVPLIGRPIAVVGSGLALIGRPIAVVGSGLALVKQRLAGIQQGTSGVRQRLLLILTMREPVRVRVLIHGLSRIRGRLRHCVPIRQPNTHNGVAHHLGSRPRGPDG
jgi:hypothetical protein